MSNHETFLPKEVEGHIRELTGPMMAALISTPGENRQHWVGAKGDLVRRIGLALDPKVVIQEPLLQPTDTIVVPETKQFIVRDHFRVDTSAEAEVRIHRISDNFQKYFFNKVEDEVRGAELQTSCLTRISRDASIINELGGYDKAKCYLADLYTAMKNNDDQGKTIWLVAYVQDINGILRAVDTYCLLEDRSWNIGVRLIGGPGSMWNKNSWFLSRNS